jgi:hypothetical protein
MRGYAWEKELEKERREKYEQWRMRELMDDASVPPLPDEKPGMFESYRDMVARLLIIGGSLLGIVTVIVWVVKFALKMQG